MICFGCCTGSTQPARGVRGGRRRRRGWRRRRQWVRGWRRWRRGRKRGGARGADGGAAVGSGAVPHAAHAPGREGGARTAARVQGLAGVRAAAAHHAQPAPSF